MSVENGVVISFLNKDYELQSWNEQGEITKIEGMLTIAFSFIFPCSHIDGRKELYLIMKIMNLVNMPNFPKVDKEYEEIYREWVEDIPKLKEKIKKLETKNKELKSEISLNEEILHQVAKEVGVKVGERLDGLKKTIEPFLEDYKKKTERLEKLKKENLRLKIVSGETKSGWIQDRDLIYRNNPDTKKFEQYKCPIFFRYGEITNFKFLDDKKSMVRFYHSGAVYDHDRGYYEMPTDAYKWLKGELPEQKKTSKINIHDIKDDIDAKNYIKSIGRSTKGKYMTRVLRFLIKRRGDAFDIEEFDEECGFKGQRESRRQYIKKFIDWGFIEETKTQGIHKIIF